MSTGSGSKMAQRHVIARQRELDALELRKAGASYQTIADRMHCSVTTAYNSVVRGLGRLNSDIDQEARALVKLELERVDRALLAIWPRVTTGDLGCIDRFVRLSELRAKYLALFAPERAQIEVTLDDVSGARERLTQQLARIADRERAPEDTGVLN